MILSKFVKFIQSLFTKHYGLVEERDTFYYFYVNLVKIGEIWYLDIPEYKGLAVDVAIENKAISSYIDAISSGQRILKLLVSAVELSNSIVFTRTREDTQDIYYKGKLGGIRLLKRSFNGFAFPRTIWIKRVPIFDLKER